MKYYCYTIFIFVAVLFSPLLALAQLNVIVSPPKVVGNKAIVQLALTNDLAEPVESARAVCFLTDDHGKMLGQSAKWVIGGTKDGSSLPSRGGTTFNFVINSQKPPVSTNLTVKVTFVRMNLSGGKQADIRDDVVVMPP